MNCWYRLHIFAAGEGVRSCWWHDWVSPGPGGQQHRVPSRAMHYLSAAHAVALAVAVTGAGEREEACHPGC
eukprot:scaffold129365_cov17-Tisochrysis_lutea.AAC.2